MKRASVWDDVAAGRLDISWHCAPLPHQAKRHFPSSFADFAGLLAGLTSYRAGILNAILERRDGFGVRRVHRPVGAPVASTACVQIGRGETDFFQAARAPHAERRDVAEVPTIQGRKIISAACYQTETANRIYLLLGLLANLPQAPPKQ
jgi:hypothetical protein